MTRLEDLMARESVAAAAYERRWTMRTLQRVEPGLHDRLMQQRAQWHEALICGDEEEAERQGEAMCRGWVAAVSRMEAEGAPDDAYLLGQHGGMVVAVGARPASGRVAEAHGQAVVWLTPDEVAAMVAGLQGLAAVKELWPDSEVVRVLERYPDEPAKED
jgi:hypothetical protein